MRKRRMLAGIAVFGMLCGVHTGNIIAETTMDEQVQEIAVQIAEGSNGLGNRLIAELVEKKENVFISPYSIAAALSMLSSCSEDGEHVEELREFLGYEDLTDEEIRQGHKWLMEELNPENFYDSYSEEEKEEQGIGAVEIANALYMSDQLDLTEKEDALEDLFSAYQAEVNVQPLDTEETMDEINQWVNEKTHEMIPSLLDEPMSPETLMMLMNTVYFKGYWVNSFDERSTAIQTFYAPDKELEVDMMHQEEHFSYIETDEYQIVSLPYYYGYEMKIYLPKDESVYEKWADEEHWIEITETDYELEYVRLNLSLPKFELEYETELAEVLQDMGLESVFEEQVYDRISEDTLQVSSILHKTAMKNDEHGTEAAAVTAVIFAGGAIMPQETIDMVVDRPFYFTITEKGTGVNLFEGCVFYPES